MSKRQGVLPRPLIAISAALLGTGFCALALFLVAALGFGRVNGIHFWMAAVTASFVAVTATFRIHPVKDSALFFAFAIGGYVIVWTGDFILNKIN